MELTNTHCHTYLSGHGSGTVEGYVAAAETAGLSLLAFTEHYPLSEAKDPSRRISMAPSQIETYIGAIETARDAHPLVELVVGTELDYFGGDEDRNLTEADFEPFALILGSVHFIDNWAFDNPHDLSGWEEAPDAADHLWRRYFELWCQAASDKKQPFQVMSHPDLVKKFAYYPRFPLLPLYEEAAEACASAGRMIEVNTSGSSYACKEFFPAPAFLAACCRANIPCTIGTDAHDPRNVARGIREAHRYLYDAGYREITVPTADGDRRSISLS